MDRCNELCTKDTTGTCSVCEARTEADRFIRFWFHGGVFIDGFRALKSRGGSAYLCWYAWRIERLRALGKALRCWWYPIPHPPWEPRHKDVVREAHKQYSETLNRTMLALLGIAFFCLLTALGSPDKLLLAPDSTIKVPFADTPISFLGFIVVAPFLLLVLLLYLHIFYGFWIACEWERQYINQHINQRLIPPIESMPTLFSLPTTAPRVLTGFIFYWLVPLVLGVITWKAWAFPAMGRPLTYVFGIVTISLVLLQLRRSRPQSTGWTRVYGIPLFLVISLMVLVTFSPQRFRRPFYLFRAVLSDAWLGGVDMRDASLGFANLQRAYLQGADLQQANLQDATLQQAKLSLAALQQANLQDATLQQADLLGANLQQANLQDATLQQANLLGANLQQAKLQGATLQWATLQWANLQQADLQGADLREATLPWAKLQGADLREATLQGADLHGADLQQATLQWANLQQADLREANLQQADLRGANLSEAQNLTQDQVTKACGDITTELPAHLADLTLPLCPE